MQFLNAFADFLIRFVGFLVFPFYIVTRRRWARKICFSNPMVAKAAEQARSPNRTEEFEKKFIEMGLKHFWVLIA